MRLILTGGEQSAEPYPTDAWRAAIEHAAGCLTCRTPGAVSSEGERLLRTHEEATRKARSGGVG
ncbi:hypothetical protein [Streptomyces sp. PSAA01]|uniref:hypothetical protein n=1 Tax=Streptomyces sp. PSAA01 TaxID=2912762 RepID=UPI001F296963|nr:hypothetical protein [Streptomyces sp. PSAA01]MCG0285197.1 hypothetical protein [Streptomyces sp. PSAA01]